MNGRVTDERADSLCRLHGRVHRDGDVDYPASVRMCDARDIGRTLRSACARRIGLGSLLSLRVVLACADSVLRDGDRIIGHAVVVQPGRATIVGVDVIVLYCTLVSIVVS